MSERVLSRVRSFRRLKFQTFQHYLRHPVPQLGVGFHQALYIQQIFTTFSRPTRLVLVLEYK